MTKSVLLATALLLGLNVLAGCAPTVQEIRADPPVAAARADMQAITITITADTAVQGRDGFATSMDELYEAVRKRLVATRPGVAVSRGVPGNAAAGTRLDLTIEDFRYVSGAARFMVGVIAGNARLRVHVRLSDAQTGAPLGESVLGSTSSGKQGVLGPTTGRQIEAVAERVAAMIAAPDAGALPGENSASGT